MAVSLEGGDAMNFRAIMSIGLALLVLGIMALDPLFQSADAKATDHTRTAQLAVMQMPSRIDPIEPGSTLASRPIPPCGKRTRIGRTNAIVVNFQGCDYATVLSFLPTGTTVTWTSSRSTLGTIIRHDLSVDDSETRLVVSSGPRIAIRSADAFAGEPLQFRLSSPPERRSRAYRTSYILSTDRSGRVRANRGEDFESIEDEGFLNGKTLSIYTSANRRPQQLFVQARLSYPLPSRRQATYVFATGAASVVPRPVVRVANASVEEGEDLIFLATIDRANMPNQAIAYRGDVSEGSAALGTDFQTERSFDIEFPSGQSAVEIPIPTIVNEDSTENLSMTLTVRDGRRVVGRAVGTILNFNSAVVTDPPEPVATPEVTPVEPPVVPPEPSAGVTPEVNPDNKVNVFGLFDVGLDLLAAVGALAIGLLGGFLFSGKGNGGSGGTKTEPEELATPEEAPQESSGTAAAFAPVVGWSTTPAGPPRPDDGSVEIATPSFAINVALEEPETDALESVPIISEAIEDG